MNLTHILELDRMVLAWFNGSNSLFIDSLATTLTSGFTWIPLYVILIYVIIKNNDTMPQIFLTIGCAVLAVVVVSVSVELIIKPLVGRWRPSNDPLIKHTIKIVNGMRGGQYSFFSAHAANTFSLAVYLSLLIKSRPLAVMLCLWSAVNCWTRLYLGLHYPLDILFGLLWGTIVGWSAYTLYRRWGKPLELPRTQVTPQTTPTAYLKADVGKVLLTMALWICAIIIHCLFNA